MVIIDNIVTTAIIVIIDIIVTTAIIVIIVIIDIIVIIVIMVIIDNIASVWINDSTYLLTPYPYQKTRKGLAFN